jgi:hypothetical protein
MERRSFLNLLSFGVVGAAAPTAALANKTPRVSDAKKDGPICTETLQLQSGIKRKPKLVDNNKQFVIFDDEYEEFKRVGLAVGQDGDLWLKKENGDWKRIVTE